MNILQITPYFYPAWSYGGIPRVVYGLSKALVRLGNKVIVLTTDVLSKESRYGKRKDIVDGIETYYFPNINNSIAYNYQVFMPLGMRKWLSGNLKDINIAHFHGHRHFLNNITFSALKKEKIPYVLSAHGTILKIERRIALKSVFDIIWGNKIIQNADHFIAVSEKEEEQYKSIGIPKEMISVVNNGLDINEYNKLPEKDVFRNRFKLKNKKIILYLGKITPRKGLDILVKAVARLPYKDTVLVVAGNDMGFKTRVDKIISEYNLKDKVIFTGLLIGKDKLSAYVDADVLVYPSTLEIFGLVPFEAIMCYTPVIVTDDCGCGDIIKKVGAGYLVKYGDITGLRNTILEVLNNKEEAKKRVQKGQDFIRKNLEWEHIACKIRNIYEKISINKR